MPSARSTTPGSSPTCTSPTGSCSRRWPGSATGSCACRPSATAPAWSSRRWSRASASTTATRRRRPRCCASSPPSARAGRWRSSSSARSPTSCAPRRPPSPATRAADFIDLNMGCPVPKVCKTGAGAALIDDPDLAVAVALAAREGSGLPVTVKIRSGRAIGARDGFDLAHRLVDEAGVAAIGFHPRSAQVHHKGSPDLDLARELVADPERAGDPQRRHERPRLDPPRLRVHGLRGGHARARRARQPVAVRAPARHARRRADDGRGARRARVGHAARGRAHGGAPGGPLPAQVLPLVRRPDRRLEGPAGERCRRPTRSTRRAPCWPRWTS